VGEVGSLTLRTSIIGRELATTNGLVEWFLSNRGGSVQGYRRSIFSGVSTLLLGRIIADLLENHPRLSGTWHVSSTPITKLRLLQEVNEAFDAGVEIEPVDGDPVDRSLDSSRFRKATGFDPPGWEQMIREMASDQTPYEYWRQGS
jgi:dTDP-4-dehydrorhamnose reductase